MCAFFCVALVFGRSLSSFVEYTILQMRFWGSFFFAFGVLDLSSAEFSDESNKGIDQLKRFTTEAFLIFWVMDNTT